MYVAILELLPDGSSGFARSGSLQFDDFYKLWDAAEVLFFVRFRSKILYGNGDRRVRLLLLGG